MSLYLTCVLRYNYNQIIKKIKQRIDPNNNIGLIYYVQNRLHTLNTFINLIIIYTFKQTTVRN